MRHRLTEETFQNFYFKVLGFERSYAFGINLDSRYDRAFDEHANIHLRAELLTKHRLQGTEFELVVMSDLQINLSETTRHDEDRTAIGSLHMRKNHCVAYVGVPDRAISKLWPAIAGQGLGYVGISARKKVRGPLAVFRISFQDHVDPNDI